MCAFVRVCSPSYKAIGGHRGTPGQTGISDRMSLYLLSPGHCVFEGRRRRSRRERKKRRRRRLRASAWRHGLSIEQLLGGSDFKEERDDQQVRRLPAYAGQKKKKRKASKVAANNSFN